MVITGVTETFAICHLYRFHLHFESDLIRSALHQGFGKVTSYFSRNNTTNVRTLLERKILY